MSEREDLNALDGYDSDEDDDYVPEAGVDDIEYPSGDDDLESGEEVEDQKKKRTKKTKSVKENEEEPKPSAVSTADVTEDDCTADFLDDILGLPPSTSVTLPLPKFLNQDVSSTKPSASKSVSLSQTLLSQPDKTTVVTDVFDFAGEEIKVEREVTAEELAEREKKEKEKEENQKKKPTVKRTGLGAALNLLTKKPKMSILDKTSLDWNSFKDEAKITEELATHNRGKDGYLNKVDFLQRTDLREFEKEKNIRNSQRKQQ